MKTATIKKYWAKGELTPAEREALQIAADKAGTYPECAKCKRCVGSCDLIGIEYNGMLEANRD